jgi:outer membrane protein
MTHSRSSVSPLAVAAVFLVSAAGQAGAGSEPSLRPTVPTSQSPAPAMQLCWHRAARVGRGFSPAGRGACSPEGPPHSANMSESRGKAAGASSPGADPLAPGRVALRLPHARDWASAVQAQAAPAPGQAVALRLTLDEALQRALATSHRLGEFRARKAAARAVVDQRGTAHKPIVSTQLGYQRTNHVDEFVLLRPGVGLQVLYPDVPDNYRARLELQWPIYTGGRLQALERAARAEVEASGQELATARADLRLEVTRAFWAIVTAREAVRVLEQAMTWMDARLADVRARFDAGFVPPNDVLLVEAQRAREQVSLIEARNLAAVSEADLARLVGAPDGTAIEVDANLAPPPPQMALPSMLFDEARAARPERAALQLRTRVADEREAAAQAGRLPAVSFLTGADYARPNPRIFPREDAWHSSWDVGVSLSWNAWDAGRTRAEVAEAASLGEAVRERLAEFDTTLALEIRQRTLELESARAQIAAAEEGVRASTEARRVVQERFAAGVATATDLLDAQVALLEAELDRTRALAGARLASARLDRALGR